MYASWAVSQYRTRDRESGMTADTRTLDPPAPRAAHPHGTLLTHAIIRRCCSLEGASCLPYPTRISMAPPRASGCTSGW
eukprot:4606040-Prymnesium_polylepis.1